jgi:hypothetical protein
VRARLVGLVVIASSLAPAALAHADTYCVNTTGCDALHDEGSSFSQALDDAKNHAGPDTIMLGSAPITTATGFTYVSPDAVTIVGAGGRAFGQSRTSISDTSASPNSHTVLKVVSAQPSTISGLGVMVPSGSSNVGIDTNGSVNDVAVEGASPQSAVPVAVLLEAGGALIDSDVDMPTAGTATVGVFVTGLGARVDGSTIEAARGVLTPTGAGGPVSATVRHSEIVTSTVALSIDAGDFVVEDSVLRNTLDNSSGHEGVRVGAPNVDTSVALNHVTMVGPPSPTGSGLRVVIASSHTAALSFRNSVLVGYGASLVRSASSSGAANITTDYSDYSGPTTSDTGPGSITETNHLTAAPGFLSVSDFHLRADSPLIDAGDPAALGSGESATDLSGQPRITDGNGDCSARRDVGAYEFQPGPRAPRAVATALPVTALVGAPVSFDASASCDPDGDALTYAWAFDDGAAATGATASHSFTTPGSHFGIVTVTDPAGRSASATASVLVTKPPPAPAPTFAGVTIAKQTVRVSKRGVAAVKVKCPASTAAGPCAGRLTLVGRKASFRVATGKTKKVAVKLSKATLKALRKKGRIKTTATARAHDAKGTSKTTHGKVTLLTPR